MKFSDVIAETARRTECGVEVAELLLRLYFEDVRNALTSLAFPQVRVLNLGTFCLKSYAMEKRLERKGRLLEVDGGYNEEVRRTVVEEMELMREAMEVLRREKERRRNLKH